MKKDEFIAELTSLLEKKRVADANEIISEYEQHFDFKLADGYTEEEISAKLGSPRQIAEQYEQVAGDEKGHSSAIVKIGLAFVDLFAGMFFLLLATLGVVIGVASVAFAALGLCMIVGANPNALIPSMPYWCGAVLGVSLIALGVLTAVGCVYYWALIRQTLRSFGRFQHNALASAAGRPTLPSLPVHAQLNPRLSRRLRKIALIALMAFAVCFVLGFIACALSAGDIQFWHAWGWFGGTAN